MISRGAHSKKTIKREGRFFVYIVQCNYGIYYTGYTNELENRVAMHNIGKGAKYVKYKLSAELIYAKEYRYYKRALNEERRVKKLSREQKTKLVRAYAESNSK
jgi:putative endonuclease